MIDIRTILRWQDADPAALRGHTVVVIDVLRWSTVVITALANGAREVEAHATPDEARARATVLGRKRVLLGGERDNVALPGFDLGNSPLEYTRERVAGRTVVTTTTNGTQALGAAVAAREVLVGAFVNLAALVARVVPAAESGPITLLCAGQAGEEAPEDTACAGAIAASLGAGATFDAGARHASGMWARSGCDAATVLRLAPHAASLGRGGFAADVRFAAAVSSVGLVPSCDPGNADLTLRPAP